MQLPFMKLIKNLKETILVQNRYSMRHIDPDPIGSIVFIKIRMKLMQKCCATLSSNSYHRSSVTNESRHVSYFTNLSYGTVRAYLYFKEGDFSQTEIIRQTYQNLNDCLTDDMLHTQQLYVGLSGMLHPSSSSFFSMMDTLWDISDIV